MAKKIIVLPNQTIFDIAVQCYGHVDGVELLMEDNPGIITHLTMVITPGMKLNIISPVIDATVVEYYLKNKIVPATGVGLPAPATETFYILKEDGGKLLLEPPLNADDSVNNAFIKEDV
jgi:hypothetical protein